MFRVTVSTHEQSTTIRVEGCLKGMSVPDFRRACHSVGTGVRLDLAGLDSADAAGISVLRSLWEEGAELLGVTPYIRCLLEEDVAAQ
jgi:anti-anti-sigma regulatory factor